MFNRRYPVAVLILNYPKIILAYPNSKKHPLSKSPKTPSCLFFGNVLGSIANKGLDLRLEIRKKFI